MIKGIDISAYQKDFTKVPAGAEFVIIKATEGRTWTNRYLAQQVDVTRAAGKQLGFYHWLHKGNVVDQIDHLRETVAKYVQPGDLFDIDYERCLPKNPDPTEADMIAAVTETQRVFARHQVLTYMNLDWWRTRNRSKTKGDGLHLAHYGVGPGKAGTDEWLIHQYTAPDFNDTVEYDWNVARFDNLRAMQAWALGKEPVPAAPFKVGQRVTVATSAGLHARSGPELGDSTATGRYVAEGYDVDVEKLAWSPVDRMWFARGATYWYSCDYLKRVPPTEYLVDINPGSTLNARSGPSTQGTKVLAERARGYIVLAERTVPDADDAKNDYGKPRRWAVTQNGEHYATEYLQKVK